MRIKLIIFILGAILVVPYGSVLALDSTASVDESVSSDTTAGTRLDSIAEQRAQEKATRIAQRCSIIETKVKLQVSRFENNLSRREAFFNRFAKRVEKLITKLSEDGYDTTKLEADLVVLNQKIEKYATDKTAYIALLKQSRLYACGKSEGEFRSKLLEARTALNTSRLSNLDVRDYYRNTIRPDILELKKQVKESKTSTEDGPSTTPRASN